MSLATPARSQNDIAKMSGAGRDIRRVKIADGIYQFTTLRDSYVRVLNSVAIVNEKDVLVFDTNTRPSSARLILEQIRKITNKPVRFVVNSHWHPDHWSGNQVYADAFPGVEIIATRKTVEFMKNTANLWPRLFRQQLATRQAALEKEIASGKLEDGSSLTPEKRAQDEADVRDYGTFVDEATTLRRVFPNFVYVDSLTLEHGGREFRFMSMTGDAQGTTILYLPREKILITGDAISYPMPYVRPDGQAETLKKLAQLDVDVIIPGHGPAFHDKDYLRLELALIEEVTNGVRDALRNGAQTLDEIQKAVTADDLRAQFTHGDSDLEARFTDRVKALARLAVRELRDGQDLP